jgi:hypothetical protein
MSFGENGAAIAPAAALTPAEAAARRKRSLAIGLALAGMVVVFYALTIVKLAGAHG